MIDLLGFPYIKRYDSHLMFKSDFHLSHKSSNVIYILFLLGFGSTRQSTVQRTSVHYDCGCIITENGELIEFFENEDGNRLNVPAIYAVYFSTFGAIVSHFHKL